MRVFLMYLLMSNFSYAHINFKKTFSKKYKAKKLQMKNAIKGGAMDGGGSGANFPESGAAWFYQDKKEGHISICIKRDPSFKADLTEAKRTIIESFKTWDKYITDQKIYDERDDNGNPIPYNKKLKILTKIKIHEKCSKDIDVTFYFGTIDKKVQAVLDNMVNPKAFAYRNYSDIDAINGTSKGMVYIYSPKPIIGDDGVPDYSEVVLYDWSKPNFLNAMVLHEIGHIMGVPHIENTIMDTDFEHLYSFAQSQGSFGDKYRGYLTKIDHGHHVYFNINNLKTNYGTLGMIGSQEEKDTFKFFTGNNLQGKSKISFNWPNFDNQKFEVTMSDDSLSHKFSIDKFEQTSITLDFSSGPQVFKRVRKYVWYTDVLGNIKYDYNSDVEMIVKAIIHGTFEYQNNPIHIDLNFNMGRTYIPEGETRSHFSQSPVSMHYINPTTQKRMPLLLGEMYTNDWSDDDDDDDDDDWITTKQKRPAN